MNYLTEVFFDEETIKYLNDNIPSNLIKVLNDEEEIVKKNMKFIQDLGIENYVEIFKNYYDLFLMDPNEFASVFNKYDREDLIDKLKKNVAIIEHL